MSGVCGHFQIQGNTFNKGNNGSFPCEDVLPSGQLDEMWFSFEMLRLMGKCPVTLKEHDVWTNYIK
jgi:hypothetical protein